MSTRFKNLRRSILVRERLYLFYCIRKVAHFVVFKFKNASYFNYDMITSLEKYLTTLSTSCSFVGEKGNGTSPIREVILTTSYRSKLALSLSIAIISINEIQ